MSGSIAFEYFAQFLRQPWWLECILSLQLHNKSCTSLCTCHMQWCCLFGHRWRDPFLWGYYVPGISSTNQHQTHSDINLFTIYNTRTGQAFFCTCLGQAASLCSSLNSRANFSLLSFLRGMMIVWNIQRCSRVVRAHVSNARMAHAYIGMYPNKTTQDEE